MADKFVLSFVEKLILLEERAGAFTQYRNHPPISTSFYDALAVQAVARDLANWIGLTQFRFIVAFARQRESVGGHIDLRTRGEEVFIEIDPQSIEFPDAVGATLCHEICHKWLHVMGVESSIRMDNEILTDITTVFLGFGKIMLNGCRVRKTEREAALNGTATTTTTRTWGYLSREQLAFVYWLVCRMRKLPTDECLAGLNAEAAAAMRACDRDLGHHCSDQFHRQETLTDALATFEGEGRSHQRQLAELNRHRDYVMQSYSATVTKVIHDSHEALYEMIKTARHFAAVSDQDPALRFLRAIQQKQKLEEIRLQIATKIFEIRGLIAASKEVAQIVSLRASVFPAPSAEMSSVVTCPRDGTELRLPANTTDEVAQCPSCGYRFVYDSGRLQLEPDSISPPSRPMSRFWHRFFKRNPS